MKQLTLIRNKITKVEPYVINGIARYSKIETTVLLRKKMTYKKGWELAEKDSKDNGFNTSQGWNDPIGHVAYEYNVIDSEKESDYII